MQIINRITFDKIQKNYAMHSLGIAYLWRILLE